MTNREQDIVLTDAEVKQIKEQMEEFRDHKKKKSEEMKMLQSLPYEVKKRKAIERIHEFVRECEARDFNCHVAVGGRDSIVLLALIRSLGYTKDRIPAISVSGIEDKSIIAVHKEMDVIMLKPLKGKRAVIEEFGWPVASKSVTNKIARLQNATVKNATTRYGIITGECGKRGHYQKSSKMKLAQKWLDLFGGWDELGKQLGYKHPNWLVSDKCCYYLKEKPCNDWAKQHNSVPFLGLMASEGGRRADALKERGCNYFGKNTIRSCPFAPWYTDEVIRMGVELKVHFPDIYGDTKVGLDGKYYSTGETRTGCNICGFGIQMEKRPHRFDRLYLRNPNLWEKIMTAYAKDLDGNLIGWGNVLDYIGIDWRHPEMQFMQQMTLENYLDSEVDV